jgi:hypothetical protein
MHACNFCQVEPAALCLQPLGPAGLCPAKTGFTTLHLGPWRRLQPPEVSACELHAK